MTTENLDVISTSTVAGRNPTANALPSPFASSLSITVIAMTAAGVLAGGVAVSMMASIAVH